MTIGEMTYFVGDTHKNAVWVEGDINIGNWSQIADGVRFFIVRNHPSAHDHSLVNNYQSNWLTNSDDVILKDKFYIGNDVWIGQNAVIYAGVTIGNGAIIGAHSVVRKNVPDYAVVTGNPARVIRMRFKKDQIEKLNKIAWWNWDEDTIKQRWPDMKDVNQFVEKYGTDTNLT